MNKPNKTMKRPNITPGEWHVGTKPGPIVYGPNGEQVTAENLMLPDEENKANARAIAALPDLLSALEGLMQDKYLADPINAERMAPARAALLKAGYEF